MLLHDTWRARFGKTPPVYCTDAFTHAMVLFRDMIQWLGCREVSRDAIDICIKRQEDVVLIPGGQTEIFATCSWIKEVTVYTGHKGFIRMAMQSNADLVPIFSFGCVCCASVFRLFFGGYCLPPFPAHSFYIVVRFWR